MHSKGTHAQLLLNLQSEGLDLILDNFLDCLEKLLEFSESFLPFTENDTRIS